ncbi:MAG TPA: hypothetical protein VHB21_00715, partial [Minicystis sp.]|nr:hypothetical protein [Minicystis sp.]
IYYYFADKEDLYLTVLERAMTSLGADVPPLRRAADARAFWREVTRLYEAVVALVRRDARIVTLLQRSAADVVRLTHHERLAPLMAGAYAAVASVLQNGIEVGAVRTDVPPELLFELTLAVGQTLDKYAMASGELATPEGCARSVARGVDLLRRLLSPPR